ncbi:MAG: hypothetical protein OXI69_11435 [Acidobacteriota bacterium]|nr:hypothetical protein [Acidobacteriota bacterium]
MEDKFFFLFFSMLVIAFVAVLNWDTLFPTRKDYNILTPLPVRMRTLLACKGLALVLLLLLFTLTVNAIPTVLFPLVVNANMGSLLHEGRFILESGEREQIQEQARLVFAGWFVLAHALSVTAGSAFAFLSVVSIQGILITLFRSEMLRRVSRAVQLLLMMSLLSVFFLFPKLIFSFESLQHNELFQTLFPPMWYLGLYQMLLGSGEFRLESRIGLTALTMTALCCLLTYLVTYKRKVQESWESVETVRRPARGFRLLAATFERLVLRNERERATFYFVARTLLRSQKHRVFLAGYFSVGMALVFVVLMDALSMSGTEDWNPQSVPLLSVPLILSFFILAGMRYAFTVPSELEANWIFRLAENKGNASAISGVHKAMLVLGIMPLFMMLFPSYLVVWDATTALLHLAYGFTLALTLIEILLFKFPKIPFTCSYLPGRANLKGLWFPYFLFFVTYAHAMAKLEAWLFGNPLYFILFYAFAIPALLVAVMYRNRLWNSDLAIVYLETAEPTVRTLKLGG